MGFGGSGSMNVVMRNNRNLLLKREIFKKSLGGYNPGEKIQEFNLPNAKPRVLKRIKERMIEEQKQRLKVRIIVFITIAVVSLPLLTYALSN